jgi:hypothetical protein
MKGGAVTDGQLIEINALLASKVLSDEYFGKTKAVFEASDPIEPTELVVSDFDKVLTELNALPGVPDAPPVLESSRSNGSEYDNAQVAPDTPPVLESSRSNGSEYDNAQVAPDTPPGLKRSQSENSEDGNAQVAPEGGNKKNKNKSKKGGKSQKRNKNKKGKKNNSKKRR